MLKELKDWIKEEISDENKYFEMAEKAPDKYKGILKDIGNEEKNHARLLKEILDDYCGGCYEEEAEKEEPSEISQTAYQNSVSDRDAVKELFNIK